VTMPWMALVAMLALALLVLEVPRQVVRRQTDLSRRAFLARVTGGAAGVVAGGSVIAGITQARGEHEIVDVEVRLAKLPRALDGFTIVQLSDLHTGLTIDRGFVQRVVDRANALAPDVIALTGDLIDGPVAELRDHVAPLGSLRAKHGVFAITGNHEYYAGADAWIEEITRLGARYLRNERVTLAPGLDLAGVDDYSADRYRGHGEDIPAATAGRDPSHALVLLAHQPRQVKNAAKYGVDLQLSGHTHGGQIWPWHYIVRLQQGGLLAGLYQHEGTQLYVTRGCGYWGPPVRLLAPLEITRVILRAA
jgi:predicted MPP superfamily phosphohydrolase